MTALAADTAVALHYNEDLPAPIVLASGRGALAKAIARIAAENGVPLVADADLAASLIELDVNTLIPESLYEVIANLLVFVRGLKMDTSPTAAGMPPQPRGTAASVAAKMPPSAAAEE